MSQKPISINPDDCNVNTFTVVSLNQEKRGDDQIYSLLVRGTPPTPFSITAQPQRFLIRCGINPDEIKRNARVKITWLPGPYADGANAFAVEVLDAAAEEKFKTTNHAKQEGTDYICAAGVVRKIEQLAGRDTEVVGLWAVWLKQDTRAFIAEIDPDEVDALVGEGISIRAIEADAADFDLVEAKAVYRVIEYSKVEKPEIEMTRKIVSKPTIIKNDAEPCWRFGTVASITHDANAEEVFCRLVDDESQYVLCLGPKSLNAELLREGDEVGFQCTKDKYHGDAWVVSMVSRYPSVGTSTAPIIITRSLNESVAVIQKLKTLGEWAPGLYRVPADRTTWSLVVKHRTGGPKRYDLAFIPDTDKLQPDTLVRIFWLAKNDEAAKKEAIALRIDPIGSVVYHDFVYPD